MTRPPQEPVRWGLLARIAGWWLLSVWVLVALVGIVAFLLWQGTQ